MTSHVSADCATRGAVAPKKCGGCKTSAYCSEECQLKDWSMHKVACKDLQLDKQLSRVAEIAHQAYLTFREDTWGTPIVKIEDTEDALVTYDGDQTLNKDYFVDFPHYLIKNQRVKMAVLCMLVCNEPLAWMHRLIEALVKDLRVHVDEIDFTLRSIPRKTIAVHPDGYRHANWPTYTHALIRFTSIKTKNQWALDLGGGQYGICSPFWKWRDYTTCFVDTKKAIKVTPFGTTKASFEVLGKVDGNPSLTYGMMGEVAEVINPAITKLEKAESFAGSKLVSEQDTKVYQERKVALLKALHDVVRRCVKTGDFKTRFGLQRLSS